MLEIKKLDKSFGNINVLDSFELNLKDGEIYSLLGENGSGKTTVLNIATGILLPDNPSECTLKIGETSLAESESDYKRKYGYVQATPFFYDELTIKEFILFVATMYDIQLDEKRYSNLLEIFEIDGDVYIGNLSFGQRQKVAIITSLIHRPELLILDEPTIGLDPISLKFLKNLIRSLKSYGVTIIFATHILEIASKLSDRIGILKDGKVFAQGTMKQLRSLTDDRSESLEEIFIRLTGGEKYRNLLNKLEELEQDEKNYYTGLY